jgi:hypothetical protein
LAGLYIDHVVFNPFHWLWLFVAISYDDGEVYLLGGGDVQQVEVFCLGHELSQAHRAGIQSHSLGGEHDVLRAHAYVERPPCVFYRRSNKYNDRCAVEYMVIGFKEIDHLREVKSAQCHLYDFFDTRVPDLFDGDLRYLFREIPDELFVGEHIEFPRLLVHGGRRHSAGGNKLIDNIFGYRHVLVLSYRPSLINVFYRISHKKRFYADQELLFSMESGFSFSFCR